MATKYRISNVTDAPVEVEFRVGQPPKADAGGRVRDTRPRKSVKLPPKGAVDVDQPTLDALKTRPGFKGAVNRGWLQVTSGDVVPLEA